MQLIKKYNELKLFVGVLLFTIAVLGFSVVSSAQQMAPDASVVGSNSLQKMVYKVSISNALERGKLGGIRFKDKKAMRDFYVAREKQPFWDQGEAREMLELIANSWTHGLNPENYHFSEIREMMQGGFASSQGELELLLTDAAIRYGQDVSGMRIDPNSINSSADYWQQPYTALSVLEQISASRDPVKRLEKMSPQHKLYKALQEELVKLSEERAAYDHVLPMSFGGDHHFTPGEVSRDVPNLRIRLGVTYDEANGNPNYYDDKTAAAVMQFQREHNLEPDGIVGPQTLQVLNLTNRARMEQVVANLERQRWLTQTLPERYLLVNIPQQILWAVEDGRVEHEMKVVVGMPWRRTKDFKSDVTGVRLNPTWTAPLSIKMKDLLPKAQEDPGYLVNKGIEVIRGYGSEAQTLDPYSVDWANMTWSEMGKLRMVQSSGDHNALGRVRILMPNKYNIYFHDTNHPEFFERTQRTYSSGCVRLSEPEKIAQFVMKGTDGWSSSDFDRIVNTGKMTDLKIDKPFPAYIVYHTMWMDTKGKLVFGADVYKRDKELLEVLAANKAYSFPEVRDTKLAGRGDANQAYASAD